MPPRGATGKRKRQYEHIKESVKKSGRSTATAKRIAAATTNQTKTAKGETKSRKSAGERERSQRELSAAGRKGGRARPRSGTKRS
ncbi:MAG: plasmid stabilization protein [Candidatus Limnocylindria bacterium]